MIKDIISKNEKLDVSIDKLDKLKDIYPECFDSNGDFLLVASLAS